MKKILRKLHLWLSIPFGILLSVIALSGGALLFEEDILRWENRNLYDTCTERPPLEVEQLLETVAGQLPEGEHIVSYQSEGDPAAPVRIRTDQSRKSYFADPATGEIKGTEKRCKFFWTLKRLHRTLFIPQQGRLIVGISTLLLTLILITGIVLWIPKNRKQLKNRLSIKFGMGRKRLWIDSHISGGIYTAIPLLILCMTGLTWSFGWYNRAFYAIVTPAQKTAPRSVARPSEGETPNFAAWAEVARQIRTEYPDFDRLVINNGQARVYPHRYGNVRCNDRILFNTADGTVTDRIPYAESSARGRAADWVYILHTGRWCGLFSKVVTLLATLACAMLAFTGYYFWLDRILKKRRHPQK